MISVSRKKVGLTEMKYDVLIDKLYKQNVYVFSFIDLKQLFPKDNVDSLKRTVFNWIKREKIIRLKRGLYELVYPKRFDIPDLYIANRMYQPSYVSLETVLSMNSIIPEIAMQTTSITTKATRIFSNAYGRFTYRTIKKEYFTGYYIESNREFSILIAEPEKAIVDYLYLNKSKKIDRLNYNAFEKLSKNKLKKYAILMNVELDGIYDEL